MCKPLVLTSVLLIGLSLIAQKQKEKDIPGWGKIDKADLELKERDFDKNAEALVLFDAGELVGDNFGPLELDPFVADTRFLRVFFDATRKYNITGNITIPKRYSFDKLTKNLRMILPGTSISYTRMSALFEKPTFGAYLS